VDAASGDDLVSWLLYSFCPLECDYKYDSIEIKYARGRASTEQML
jgi:hypothetical protein